MKVRDIMTNDILAVSENEPVFKAAQVMKDANIGSVPVQSGDSVTGIVTDRDIVIRNVAENKDANSTNCKDIMSKNVISCSADMDTDEVSQLMSKHQIRRIPVVENNKIIGMVSLGDLATLSSTESDAGEALSDISTPSYPRF